MQTTPDLIHIGSLKSWMAPECVSINRVAMRATIYPFPSPQSARSVDREKTPWFQLLNGQWQFKAADMPENVTLADIAADVDRSNWNSVEVPGNWTLQGYGVPQYTNVQMPFPDEPPFVPQDNYTISSNGRIQADNIFTINKAIPDLPRLGVVLTLKPGFEKLKWFGRGPFENYSDRKRAALVDLYESTVTEQYVPYIMPQEHGNHTDVRWLSLARKSEGLLVEATGPMEFSVSHYTAQDIDSAYHTYDLNPRAEVILNLDYRQRGLGTESCGPGPLEQYRIKSGRYSWSYTLRPLA